MKQPMGFQPPDAVTNPIIEHEPTRAERVDGVIREAIAGDRRGTIRRTLLYVATFALILTPAPATAVLPLALLLATDQLL